MGTWVGPKTVLDSVENRDIPCSRLESNPGSPVVETIPQSLYLLSYSKYIALEINIINIKNATKYVFLFNVM